MLVGTCVPDDAEGMTEARQPRLETAEVTKVHDDALKDPEVLRTRLGYLPQDFGVSPHPPHGSSSPTWR